MIPSDKDLNEAMARALGWRSDGTWNGKGVPSEQNWYDPKQERTAPSVKPNDYCNDRNTLPEILATISNMQAPKFGYYLLHSLGIDDMSPAQGAARYILNAEPRKVVVAALRALSLWQKEWSEDE